MAKDKTTTKVIKSKEKAAVDKTVAELRADLLVAQRSLYDDTLTNPHAISSLKKQIARKLTAENAAKVAEDKEPKAKAKEKGEK